VNIYAAYLSQETNTFSPLPTDFSDFDIMRAHHIKSGVKRYEDMQPLGVWHEKSRELGHDFLFDFAALATPSGKVSRQVYESFRDDILTGLSAQNSIDIVLLNLHGAMVAEGYEDCEGDLIQRIRQRVGADTIIAVELDLHCHLSETMVSGADIIVTFKEYPHDDVCERGSELFDYAVAAATKETLPTTAVYPCNMLGLYPTSAPVLRNFIDNEMTRREKAKAVISISFIHGFPWGDVSDGGSKVLVVTDNDQALANKLAQQLARQLFSLRHDIGFKSLSLEETFTQLAEKIDSKLQTKPWVVADQSDNPGAGAPGDATFSLRWLLEHHIKGVAVAVLHDPEAVRLAAEAGCGAKLHLPLGGKMGSLSGDPLQIEVTVLALQSDYVHLWPQRSGAPIRWPAGDVVALRCNDIDIVVSSKRIQCFSPSIFTDLGIDYHSKNLLVVKSAQHFYSAFAPIAREIIYMAGPGAVSPDVLKIPYQKMSTADKYPWNEIKGGEVGSKDCPQSPPCTNAAG